MEGAMWKAAPWLLSACVLVFAGAGAAAPASDQDKADEAVAAFEWFCLEKIGDHGRIGPLLEAIKIKPLPPDKAVPFLGGFTGNVWFLPGSFTELIIISTTNGSCTVNAPYALSSLAKKNIIDNFKTKEIASEKEGMQVERIYLMTYKYQHGIVRLTEPKRLGAEGVILSVLPESLARSQGHNITSWP
ncbi:hypothetical protein MCW82_16645 [Azospirillum doebereinerae]|uniref:NMCC_0638 family (lipo)protein n=1 Tax=Azospirillum doebereinerae TaxID=92933 RepID=UPI001EE5C7C4|nr:hypothetical protein [Azospirillum doebereinerae]MCG5241405.1 hypothetical protein [Azospirillum doebereinerae]